MDWSNITFILGNVLGAWIKKRPNTSTLWKDKYIPGWIFVSQLVAQFIAGLFPPTVPEPHAMVHAHGVALAFSLGAFSPFVHLLWNAFKQTAIAVFLNQLKKQADKPA